MQKLTGLKVFTAVIVISAASSLASAQATRTWVSGVGDDVNPCSRTAPCKTFAGAISKTAVGGEINALDPAGFGAVTISKSITIDGTGTFTSTLSSLVTGVIINITAPTDAMKTVRLRGLSINGAGTGVDAIKVLSATQVFVEDLVIDGFTQHGINVGASNTSIFVKNTTIRNTAKFGINLEPGGTTPSASLWVERSSLMTAFAGLFAGKGTKVTISDSAIVNNRNGLVAEKSDLNVVNCVLFQNGQAVVARMSSTIRLSLATVTNNEVGLAIDGGRIISFKNNVVNGNVTDGAPTSTLATL